jgi:hypothetical protein
VTCRNWHGALVALSFAFSACGGVSLSGPEPGANGAGAPGSGGNPSSVGGAGSHTGAGSHGGGTAAQAGEPSGDAGAAGAAATGCAAGDIEGLRVFSAGGWDPLGYPPYALDGCTLVYVAPDADGGALYARQLGTGQSTLLEPAASKPRRPTIVGDVIAWELDDNGKSRVRVRYGGQTRDLLGAFDHAGEPRATSDALVFTAFLGENPEDDSDVYLYDPRQDQLTPVATGPGQQRFADVSPSHVAVTDFSEDPRGYFDPVESLADVLLIDRVTGDQILRKRDGKQAFPLLGDDGALVYLDWGAVHPEPKFSQFSLRAATVTLPVELDVDLNGGVVHTDPSYVRPSLRGRYVDFVHMQDSVTGLYRVTVGSGLPPTRTSIAGSAQLFGPVAGEALTLISSSPSGQTLALTALAR